MNFRVGSSYRVPRFRYGVRICPEPVHWGGLSGCTYSEGVSWGKFVPPAEGGRFAEVFADATVVWPLLMKAVFEELDRG
jgi:deoxyhypusine synthase